MGSVTLRPSVSTTGGTVSFGAADDPASLLTEFAATGKFSSTPSGLVAASGAASASASVPAGETVTLTIIFSWYFPDRDYKANSDHTTDGMILGNMYQNLWSGSEEVATALATEERLASIVTDINAHHQVRYFDSILLYSTPLLLYFTTHFTLCIHHQVVAHVGNPAPVWLKDMLLNQFSHYHMMMWYKDGRMREYEAWSCDDVDSVHNDYQRHLLYIWAFLEFETQKMEAWGSWAQDPEDGHVAECLAGFGHGPLDKPTGRMMGDTTSIFVLEAYEYYMHTGNKTWVTSMWPSVKRAKAAGDTASLAEIQNSYSLSQTAIVDHRLWNDTEKFFRCHTADGGDGDNQIFTDSLYGQVSCLTNDALVFGNGELH